MSLNNFSGTSLIGLASSLAILISENLSTDEIAILASLFTAIGDNLAIIATQQSLRNNLNN